MKFRLEIENETPQAADPEDLIFESDSLEGIMYDLKDILAVHKENHEYAIKHWNNEGVDNREYSISFTLTTIHEN